MQADEDDTIYRVTTPSVNKRDKGMEFILLASRRKPCDARCSLNHYIELKIILCMILLLMCLLLLYVLVAVFLYLLSNFQLHMIIFASGVIGLLLFHNI